MLARVELGGYSERREIMKKSLRAQESTLFDLMRPGVELAMPPYQRSYSWEENEVRELLGDLLFATSNDSEHFIGAIVLMREESGRFLIVDGQQRLTTLTMVLAVLRDLETSQDEANALHALIADENDDLEGGGITWRLSLNHIDGPFFREAIQTRGATLQSHDERNDSESQARIIGNADFLLKQLKNMSIEARRELAKTVQQRVILVRVVVPEWTGAYQVFKVLNTRGKAPNNHDIIKTELLEYASFKRVEADSYSRQWSEHEARLGGAGLDQLLGHIRTLYSRTSKANVEGFRKAVLNNIDPREFLASELPAYVNAFVAITASQTKFPDVDPSLRRPLSHLNLVDHNLWRAPAMRFMVTHNGDLEIARDFFNRLERFAFTMMLVVTERNQRLKRYGRIAEATDKPKLLLSDRGPMSLSRDEKRKLQSRLLGRFGSFNQRRAIALRLNSAIEGDLAPNPNEGATVEHVMPRNIPDDSPWHNSWPTPDVHRELCDTIGNFVLLSKIANQKADNGSFEEKLKLYFENGKADYALTRDLENQIAWTPEIVRTRTKQLAKILSDDWQL